jgi:putative peptidoglycan lipid II flippase
MIVLAQPLAAVFFQYGLFSARSTELTARALAYFAIGLVGHIVVHVLTRAFYAMQDTRTPVTWAIIAVAMNVPLMIAFVGPMGVEGLALALSLSAVAEVIGLVWALRRRIESVEEASVLRSAGRSLVGGLAAALLMLGGLTVAQSWFAGLLAHGLGRLLILAALSVAGVAVFALVGAALRAPELDQVRAQLGRRFRRSRA